MNTRHNSIESSMKNKRMTGQSESIIQHILRIKLEELEILHVFQWSIGHEIFAPVFMVDTEDCHL